MGRYRIGMPINTQATGIYLSKGKRDRAILAVFHGLQCEKLCDLRVRDLQSRQDVSGLRVFGKGR
jgi:hypothetical protein